MHPSSAAGRSSASSCPAGFPTRPAARSRPLSTRPARPAPGPVRPAAGPVRPAAGPVRPATSAAAQPLGRPAPRTPAVHQPQGPACGGSRSHGPRKPVDHSRNIKATRRGPEWLHYRRYFAGQATSLIGTWMQSVAQSWLVLQLTGSGPALGFVVGLQMLPVLVLGPYGGVVADRVDKRRLMVALQSFVLEMVGPADLRNAVTLNSVLVNAARAVGPAVAGILIASVGTGVCFLVNAVSFVAVVYSLVSMNTAALAPTPPTQRRKGQLREGLRYVRRTPALGVPLLMMALIGTLAYEFQVVLPVLARDAFHGNASTYGFMTSAMGVGAVVGGLVTAGRGRIGLRPLTVNAAAFGLLILVAAVAPTLAVEMVALVGVGAASVSFLAVGNTTLQLTAKPTMRGRVMALWAVAFLGSTPVGGLIAGWVSEYGGGRAGLVLGGVACLLAAVLGLLARRADRVEAEVAPPSARCSGSGRPGPHAPA